MLDSLRQAGTDFRHELSRAWESLSEGWRELLSSSGNALTHFSRDNSKKNAHPSGALADFRHWSLLAGEVEETGKEIVMRVKVPGMGIEGNTLFLSGETGDSTYHVMERAYGAFQRTIPLPCNVDTDKVEANYINGVLRIRLPKASADDSRDIPVS